MKIARCLFTLLMMICLVQILFMPPAESQVIRWKGQNAYVGGASGGAGPFFAEWVKKVTNGRLIIDVAQANAIVPVPEMFRATSKGMLDFAGQYFGGYHAGQMPETDIETGLTFAWETLEHAWDAYFNRGLLEEIRKVYAENNIYWIPAFPNQIQQIGSSFPISSLADLKGKKIRATGVVAEYVKLLGASPVSLPAPEIYMALKLGTVDAAVFGFTALEDMKLKEVWKYIIVSPNCNNLVCSFMINMNSFNALPQDIKEIIDKQAAYAMLADSIRERLLMDYGIANAVKTHGLKLVTLSDKEANWIRKEVMKTVWDKVAAKSARNAKLVELVRKQMRDLGRLD
jgi:TRAP-type C4-dicarboxylate transport system substrate-binding protein